MRVTFQTFFRKPKQVEKKVLRQIKYLVSSETAAFYSCFVTTHLLLKKCNTIYLNIVEVEMKQTMYTKFTSRTLNPVN